MPKETVPDEASMYDVVVGWQRGSHVQVGIETQDGRSIAEHLGLAATPGEAQSPDPAKFTSLWGTFDRVALNLLIWHLRKARDAAFGKDA